MALKRNKPIQRKTPLARSTKPIARKTAIARSKKPIPKKSASLIDNTKIYNLIRIPFLEYQPVCGAGLTGCTHNAEEIHHKRGRGIYLLTIKYFLPVCRNCHNWIEAHPQESFIRGLSIPRIAIEDIRLQPFDFKSVTFLLNNNNIFKLRVHNLLNNNKVCQDHRA